MYSLGPKQSVDMTGRPDAMASIPGIAKDSISEEYSTTEGEAGKAVVVNEDGTVHANLSGETDHIGKKKIEISNLQDGDILVYHTSTGTYKNQAPNFVGSGKSLILYDGEKLLGDYNGGETVTIDVAKVRGCIHKIFVI